MIILALILNYVKAPNCEGIYECTYKLLSKSTKANDSLHMGVKYTFYVTKKMVPPMSSRELEGYMIGSSGCKETELKDVGKVSIWIAVIYLFLSKTLLLQIKMKKGKVLKYRSRSNKQVGGEH